MPKLVYRAKSYGVSCSSQANGTEISKYPPGFSILFISLMTSLILNTCSSTSKQTTESKLAFENGRVFPS